jgi:hypothetical protein
MRRLLFAGVVFLIPSQVFAQTAGSMSARPAQPQGAAAAAPGLGTPTGHEVNGSVSGYKYVEPDSLSISIHGAKIGGEYTGTIALSRRRHWFAQANLRATAGSVTYDGWCSPFLITPNSASPNGYQLGVGEASPCSEGGDQDWYVETRGLAGKDFIGPHVAWSPYAGVGFRHLSNGTTGIPGYRTDDYLYVPFGITARTRVASHGLLSVNLEYDYLVHGWQTTRQSELGGGDVPATATAPAFTINGFTDFSFDQHSGWALRASAKYQMTRQWSVEPYYVRWNVGDSPVSTGVAAFTVNNVTAQQQVGFYEPRNFTNEFGVKLGFRF